VAHYYYLVPQLSYLTYGQTPPISSEEFRAVTAPFLTARDAALMDMIGLDPLPLNPHEQNPGPSYAKEIPPSGSVFVDNWRKWERAFRLNLAKQRFIKTRRRGTLPVEPPASPADAVALAEKVIRESPLNGEHIINKARWNAIESFMGNDYFYRNTIFAYLLKLIILERHAFFQTETGISEYSLLYTSILEQSGISPAGEFKWLEHKVQ
jgi:hypothetical protein